MNPIAIVATLCLASSVAGRRCLSGGELEYKLFGQLAETQKDLLKETYNKTFDERDLVLSYKVVPQDGGPGLVLDGPNNFFPSVILSRSPQVLRNVQNNCLRTSFLQNKLPVYFNQTSTTVVKSGPKKFVRDLFNCTGHSASFNFFE